METNKTIDTSKFERLDHNYGIIERTVNKLKPKYPHMHFNLYRSKTSTSIYLIISTIVNNEFIKRTLRWGDHISNARVKRGSNARKINKNNRFQKDIATLIKELENIRLRIILQGEIV